MCIELCWDPVCVDEELGKVPLDFALSLLLKRFEERVSSISFHFNFVCDWESAAKAFNKRFDCWRVVWLLRSELIAWESHNLETRILVIAVHLSILLIMLLGQTSLACDIDDDGSFCTANHIAYLHVFFSSCQTGQEVKH